MDTASARVRLEEKRATLFALIESRKSGIVNANKVETREDAERSDNRQERELNLRLNDQDSLTIAAIGSALKRIETGKYGLCPDCDEPISEKRLCAIPEAVLCVDCEDRRRSLAPRKRILQGTDFVNNTGSLRYQFT